MLLVGACQERPQAAPDGDVPLPPAGPTAETARPTPEPTATLPDLCPPEGDRPAPGRHPVPNLTLNCLGSDASRNLRQLTGRPMLINIWASWCGPCKVELPLLARAHREWGDRVAFLGIDAQDASAEAWKSLTAAGVDFPQLEDPEGLSRGPFGWHSGLPMTVFVDARGRMVGTERTAFRTYPEVTAALRRHLGAGPQAQEPGSRGNP